MVLVVCVSVVDGVVELVSVVSLFLVGIASLVELCCGLVNGYG